MPSKIKHEKPADSLNHEIIRIWPGITLVIIQWLFRFVLPIIEPKAMMIGIVVELITAILIAVWWMFFSRALLLDRWIAFPIIIASLYFTSMFIDESIAKANMGLMFLIFSIPVMSLTFVTWTLITRRLPVIFRRVTMILTILLASGIWICIRTNGMTGDGRQLLDWRWAKTSEDRLLEHAENNSSVTISKDFNVKSSNIWPGFRGANRDGIVHNVFLKTDLKKSPPVELWRKPIGPGCSSFAVNQNLI
jgi:outer membrane protein assembly factor BamB